MSDIYHMHSNYILVPSRAREEISYKKISQTMPKVFGQSPALRLILHLQAFKSNMRLASKARMGSGVRRNAC